MLKVFRITALLEGISYLLLFSISMPLKYWGKIPEPNKFIGYAHGLLFILFVVLAIVFILERKLSFKKAFLILLSSLLPFGTFYLDKHYLKKLSELEKTSNS
ncbi:DUF3817 domain-containing protein [Eudoraea chungangensis]|uniref:DUF3817 domain-containing protein n=1 Tax=Eudoraea chungangensis TaxID=1481905 RepID=UPI0023EC7B58